jgi:hypothetical protein
MINTSATFNDYSHRRGAASALFRPHAAGPVMPMVSPGLEPTVGQHIGNAASETARWDTRVPGVDSAEVAGVLLKVAGCVLAAMFGVLYLTISAG